MKNTDINITAYYPKEAKRLKFILGVTSLFLVLGLVIPIIMLKKFILIESTFSILSGAIALLEEGQVFLFMIITGFSIVLPILKVSVLYKLLNPKISKIENMDRYLHWMHLYGKWSMLDVFVVAVLVVSVKFGAIASVEIRFGLYSFTFAVLLTMYITSRIVSLTNDLKNKTQKSRIS